MATSGHTLDQANGVLDLLMADRVVKAESVLGQKLHAAHEVRLNAEVHVFALHETAHALHERQLGQRVQVRTHTVAQLQRRMRHNAANARLAMRQLRHPLRLGQPVLVCRARLHEDDALQIDALCLLRPGPCGRCGPLMAGTFASHGYESLSGSQKCMWLSMIGRSMCESLRGGVR